MIGALFARRRPAPHAAVRGWVAARFAAGPGDVVSVAELACREPGCPDVETVVTVLRAVGGRIERRIEKPLVAVTEADVAALARGDD